MLGGTTEARELVEVLVEQRDVEVVVSLAGHTARPVALPCPVRTGGFGGVDGLAAYLLSAGTDVLVDATHPFSAAMAAHAVRASALVDIPTVRLVRPPWSPVVGDRWIGADDLDDARRQLVALGARQVLLTTGRLDLEPFASLRDVHFIVRSIEEPGRQALVGAAVIRERGPFTVGAELDLLRTHAVDAVVTKNSGGPDAKLVAARQAGVAVVMVRRPRLVEGARVSTARDAVAWLASLDYRSAATST